MQEHRADEVVEERPIGNAAAQRFVECELQERRRNFWPWPKHGGRQNTQDLGSALRLDPNAQRAVILRAGCGRDAFGQLFLNRYGHRLRRHVAVEQVAQDRRGHVVRQIGSDFEPSARRGGQCGGDGLHNFRIQIVLVPHRVEVEHRHVVEMMQFLAGQLEHWRIDFNRDDGCGLLGQKRRERTRARADLQDDVVAGDCRGVEQQVQQVQIDQEILPVLGTRMNARLLETFEEKGERLSGNGFSGHRRSL